MLEVTITHDDHGERGSYVAAVAGSEHTGRLDWVARGGDVRVATHTLVPPAIGGRGVAARLVEALVADARAQGFRIDPRCSYVEAMFRRNPEWGELRA
ncbi:MAG: N-acetyltransferase [Altererythrobacter sp.]|nr:N-acetyltransferase [Altererythrobacter sp.]